MKRVHVAVAALVLASAAACALNPQPFPPDNPDAALGAGDASKNNDSSTFGDAGSLEDSSPVPENDGSSDASDASDALLDVSVDAPLTDALIDAPGDVTND